MLDHWLLKRQLHVGLVFSKGLVELAGGLFHQLFSRHFHFNLAERVHLGLDAGEPRVNEGRSGNCHPIAPFWLYRRLRSTLSMYSSGVKPYAAAWSAISRVEAFKGEAINDATATWGSK